MGNTHYGWSEAALYEVALRLQVGVSESSIEGRGGIYYFIVTRYRIFVLQRGESKVGQNKPDSKMECRLQWKNTKIGELDQKRKEILKSFEKQRKMIKDLKLESK